MFTGLVSLLFVDNPEAGFAHYNIWQAVAYSVSFAYTTFLCFSIKAYIFICCLVATAICYIALEIRIRNVTKSTNITETKKVQKVQTVAM